MIRPKFITISAIVVSLGLFGASAHSAGSEVPHETVHFEIDYVTTLGTSVFVLGDIPELGGGDMRYAVKLVPGTYVPGPPPHLTWSIDIAIPYNTTYAWRYVLRNDSVSALSNAANGTALTGVVTSQTPVPSPALVDLVFYQNAGDPASAVTFNAAGGLVVVPFAAVPGHADLKAAALREQPFGPGTSATVGTTAVRTPLHTLLRRGEQVFNYVPDAGVAGFAGRRETFAVPSAHVVSTRTDGGVTGRGVQVWLPRGYDQHVERRYPVLYMHDGQNVFTPGGPFGCWFAEIVAAEQIRRGLVRELIIVGIDNSPNRLAEYNPDWSGSMNAEYNVFVVQELKPYIDAHYRTLTCARDTGVCGSSFGGIASLSLGLEFPEVFGRIGAMSTSFSYTTLDDDLAAGRLAGESVLYLDCGDSGTSQDGAGATIAARDAVLAAGRVLERNFFFQIGYGDQHNEAAWNRRFDEVLRGLFPITDEPRTIDLPRPPRADIDGDGCVGLADLARLLSSFGLCGGDAGFDGAADVDASGCVNLADLSVLLAEFGVGC